MTNKNWPKQRVTIKDIARLAGVDPSTVTRALQDSERVKASTRSNIRKIADNLGYVPSASARSLVTQRSGLVALVIPDMTNPFFAPLARGIEDEAARNDLRILIRNTEGRPEAERDAVKLFMELAVDGLLVPMARCPKAFYAGLEQSTPVIHVNRSDAPFQVSCDTVGGTAEIMAHLLDLGHRRIAFVAGPTGMTREPKMMAYRTALDNAGIEFDASLVYEFDGTPSSADNIGQQLYDADERPTAIFAWNDVCAIALIHALGKRGLTVPGDVSVAGHDDIEMAAIIEPPLTTVHWPMYELGVEAVRYLLSLRAGYTPDAPAIPEPVIRVRASTGKPPPTSASTRQAG